MKKQWLPWIRGDVIILKDWTGVWRTYVCWLSLFSFM